MYSLRFFNEIRKAPSLNFNRTEFNYCSDVNWDLFVAFGDGCQTLFPVNEPSNVAAELSEVT